jgi:hypothetical protein
MNTKFFLAKIRYECQKIQIRCWFRICWKKGKINVQKSYCPKTCSQSNKYQNVHFSITFSLVNFFSMHILQLFKWIKNQHHLRFWYSYWIWHFLLTLMPNADKTAEKRQNWLAFSNTGSLRVISFKMSEKWAN